MLYNNLIQILVSVDPEYPWLNMSRYDYLDRVTDGFAVINPVVMEEYISDKICLTLGYKRSELGKTIQDLKRFVKEEDFQHFSEMGKKIMQREIDEFTCEKTLYTITGEAKTFNVRCTWDNNGNVISLFNLK